MNSPVDQPHYKAVPTVKGIWAIKSRFYGFEIERGREGRRTQSFLVKEIEVDLERVEYGKLDYDQNALHEVLKESIEYYFKNHEQL